MNGTTPSAQRRQGGRRIAGLEPDRPGECRPVVTIATVVYNGAALLENAIRSVLSQPCNRIEYIVIDGGSTDGTVELLARYDNRIAYWISEPDTGIYDAMNKALAQARGDWLLFIGADDELKPTVSAIIDKLRDPLAVYYGDVEIAATGAISGGKFTRYRLMQENICHQAVFYPRSVYSALRYDVEAGMLADHKYNIEVWGSGVRFVHLPHVVSRFNDAGVSSRDPSYFESIKLEAIRRSFGPFFYAIKRARTGLVRLLRRRHEPT